MQLKDAGHDVGTLAIKLVLKIYIIIIAINTLWTKFENVKKSKPELAKTE
ncbi:hypothetical protein I2494_16345 [Budviciaceae bacterium BWR-B9]|uniref:Uncharacterized protein n=1 Tax=Limnobaculum allomyrinae TaxID=2791986 RepID=A0ABS1IUK6_9GAMM|nr:MULTISPECIES: hypothetical protein [Limnobaculum]MBK5145257.1 hypothetical protein [Limnobaculum allomyrinae]MBV7693089.1 hypothetical protein [Limnobaculum sp. M2-1]